MMIPDFADERINKKIAKFRSNGAGMTDYIIACGIRLKVFVAEDYTELIFCDVRGKFARIEYSRDETFCWITDGSHSRHILSAKLMEYLMSLSDDLAMWLLWNRIL